MRLRIAILHLKACTWLFQVYKYKDHLGGISDDEGETDIEGGESSFDNNGHNKSSGKSGSHLAISDLLVGEDEKGSDFYEFDIDETFKAIAADKDVITFEV